MHVGKERERDQWVTLLVKWTGLFAQSDFGSALDIVSVYRSENLGSFEETTNPVLVKDSCQINIEAVQQFQILKIFNRGVKHHDMNSRQKQYTCYHIEL